VFAWIFLCVHLTRRRRSSSRRSIKTLSFFISFNNLSYFSPFVSPSRHRFGFIWSAPPREIYGLKSGPHFAGWRVAYFRFLWSFATSKRQWRHENDKCFIFVHVFFLHHLSGGFEAWGLGSVIWARMPSLSLQSFVCFRKSHICYASIWVLTSFPQSFLLLWLRYGYSIWTAAYATRVWDLIIRIYPIVGNFARKRTRKWRIIYIRFGFVSLSLILNISHVFFWPMGNDVSYGL